MKFNFLRKVFAKVHIKSPMIRDGMRLDLSLQWLSFVGLLGDDGDTGSDKDKPSHHM